MDTPIVVRRNGKRPSCEPCRISKLSCDHQVPCARCKRRKIESRCFIHAAPMTGLKQRGRQATGNSGIDHETQPEVRSDEYNTRPTSPAEPSPRTEIHPTRPWEYDIKSSGSASVHHSMHLGISASSTNRVRSIDGSMITPSLSSVQTPNDWTPAAGLTRSGQGPNSGYLGSTSFSAVFDEKIDIVAADEPNGLAETHVECLSSQETSVKVKEGAAVLAQLADFKHFESLIVRWLEYARGLALVCPTFLLPYSSLSNRLSCL
jgi:hypothetical protein